MQKGFSKRLTIFLRRKYLYFLLLEFWIIDRYCGNSTFILWAFSEKNCACEVMIE